MRVAARSHSGPTREVNEDYVLVDPALGLVVVADGAGGVVTGVLAARLAAEGVSELLPRSAGDPEQRVRGTLRAVDQIVHEAANTEGANLENLLHRIDRRGMDVLEMCRSGRGTLRGMFASIVLAWWIDDRIVVAHAGTCRAYRVSDGAARALTVEHSVPGYPTIATQAVGLGTLESTVQSVPRLGAGRLLLCTDGLHATLDEAVIAELAGIGGVGEAVDALIDRANAQGARDNIAVAIADESSDTSTSCRNFPAWT